MKRTKRSYLQRITATVLSLLLIAQSGVLPVFAVAETAGAIGAEITHFEPLAYDILYQTVPFGTELGDLYLPAYLSVMVRTYVEPEPEIEEDEDGEGLYVAAWIAFAEEGEAEVYETEAEAELEIDTETDLETEEAETGTEDEEPEDESAETEETGENDGTDPNDSEEPGVGSDPGENDESKTDSNDPEADNDEESYYEEPPYGNEEEEYPPYDEEYEGGEYPYEDGEYPYEDYPLYDEEEYPYDEDDKSDYCYYYYCYCEYYYYYYEEEEDDDENGLVAPVERNVYPVFEQMTVPVTWVSTPAFYANIADTFVFTPVLPQGLFLVGGVVLPVVTVTVEPLGIMATNVIEVRTEAELRSAMGMAGTATVVVMEDIEIVGAVIPVIGDKTLVNRNSNGSSIIRTAGAGRHFQIPNTSLDNIHSLTLGELNNDLANNITITRPLATTDTVGGGIIVGANTTLNMYGGIISNSRNNGDGGGVLLLTLNATMNLHGGLITNNHALHGGGIFLSNNSTSVINIYGGVITANTADISGGGMLIGVGATLNMHGGTISNNRALDATVNNRGGGIHVNGINHAVGATAFINIGNVGGVDTSHSVIFYGNRIGPVGNDAPPVNTGNSPAAFSALHPYIRWQNFMNFDTQQTTSAPAGYTLINRWDISPSNIPLLREVRTVNTGVGATISTTTAPAGSVVGNSLWVSRAVTNLTITAGQPPAGYIFGNWSASSLQTGAVVTVGGFTNNAANAANPNPPAFNINVAAAIIDGIVFTAHWIPALTVNFDTVPATGGTITAAVVAPLPPGGTVGAITSGATLREGTNITFTASPAPGYRVREWRNNGAVVAGVGVNTFALQNLTANANVTVYFERIHTVTFNAIGNGGVVATANGLPIANNTLVAEGSTVVFTAAPYINHRVLQWQHNGAVVPGGGMPSFTIPNLTANAAVTAEFEIITHTVTFNLNGGEGTPPAQQTVSQGQAAARPATDPTRFGFEFVGWFLPNSATPWNFANNPVTGSITLEARWTTASHPVTFQIGGGNANATQSVLHGSFAAPLTPVPTWNAPLPPGVPPGSTITFQHWSSVGAAQGSPAFAFNTPITAPLTLYAVWDPTPPSFTVTFNSAGSSAVPPQTVIWEGRATQPPNPTRFGYQFAGWHDAGGQAFNFADTPITSAITLTAQWQLLEFTVSFDLGLGDGVETAAPYAPQNININTHPNMTAQEPPAPPERDSWFFAGWSQQSPAGLPAWNFNAAVTSDMTLTAIWLQTFTVDFYAVGNGDITALANSVPILSGHYVLQGSTVDFTAFPDPDHGVERWELNGSVVPGNTSNNFAIPTLGGSVTVTVYIVELDEEEEEEESENGGEEQTPPPQPPLPPPLPPEPPVVAPEQESTEEDSSSSADYGYIPSGIPTPAIAAQGAEQGEGGLLQIIQHLIIILIPLWPQNLGFSELLRVPIDSPTVYRSIRQNNGMYTNLREVEMDTAAWIAAETGSTMIPIRFVSYLLDLPVLWREEESTAIIDPYGMDLRITANSPYMYRNGERLPILNVDGEQVYSVIKDNRLFIPLRGTGTALGLRPAWSPNVAMLYIE